jgi:hypothetical protein
MNDRTSKKEDMLPEQKIAWLGDHLPYELKMMRYSLREMKRETFYLDWNAYLSTFAVSACNLAAFLTNSEKSGNNAQACQIVKGFRSRKENLQGKFRVLEPQVFHLGRSRPTDKGKFLLADAVEIAEWVEAEMKSFIAQLGEWGTYWDQERSEPEPKPLGPTLNVSNSSQEASSGTPQFTKAMLERQISSTSSEFFYYTGPDAPKD